MTTLTLGDFVSFSTDPWLADQDCAWLDDLPAERFGEAPALLFKHLSDRLGTDRYIDPKAQVSALANVGERVIIGPGARICEFTTVRENVVVASKVHLGYGCEVSRTILLSGATIAHRACLVHAVVGQQAWLADSVKVACLGVWNPDPLNPTLPIRIKLLDGTELVTASVKASAVFGDRVRCAADVSAGPGTLIGRDTVVYPDVRLHGAQIPAGVTIRLAPPSLVIRDRTDLSTATV